MVLINRRPFDQRTADRYKEKGLLKDADYKAHLKSLPDETENAQWVEMDLHDAELGSEKIEDEPELDDEEAT